MPKVLRKLHNTAPAKGIWCRQGFFWDNKQDGFSCRILLGYCVRGKLILVQITSRYLQSPFCGYEVSTGHVVNLSQERDTRAL